MASETDLRYAISMHPRPFHSSRDQSPAVRTDSIPVPAEPHTGNDVNAKQGKPLPKGHSTSYEATTPDEEEHDPVARHVANEREQDVEAQPARQYSPENDPYELSSKLKTADQIDALMKANTSRKRQEKAVGGKSFALPLYRAGKQKWHSHKLQGFYENQNEAIERFLKPVDDHRLEAKKLEGDTHLRYKIAVTGSFIANLLLAGLQLYAAISSKSLSLFTTMADALFDPMSNVTLMLTNRATKRVDTRRYPSGKARIETSGNIFFCFLMCAVSLIIIVESIQELVEGSTTQTKPFFLASILAVAVAFCTKLALFFYCYALRNLYSQIRILWEDHRNDLIINGFGLITSLLGSFVRWWIDPMGAILLSALIIFLWMRTAVSEFKLLIGVSAETETLQLITYICLSYLYLFLYAY
jgi:divalent metal cation (Fe/Co/Zn/Cd) transporter